MSQKRFFRPRTDPERASNFVAAGETVGEMAMDCFNICVKPTQDDTDQVRGFERRCLDGCMANNLNIFMINGRNFAKR